MILAVFALLLVQAPTQAPAAPTPISPVVVSASPLEPDPEKVAEDLAQIYDQACGARIYGTYAESCNGLAAQLAKAQAEARKSAARKAKLAKTQPSNAAGR